MNQIYTIMTLVFLIIISAVVISNNIGSVIKRVKVRPEDELMAIVNATIDREFKYVRYLEYELKNVVLIKDYEGELDKLVSRTMNAFSTEVLEELQYYYTLNYITKHVTKSHQVLLNMFINEKKINNTIKKNR